LGFPVAQEIPPAQLKEWVTAKLEAKLAIAKNNPYNLIVRKVIANHLIDSSLWYWLTLWNGLEKDLHAMQRRVVKFVWAGQKDTARHRVDHQTLCKPLHQRGLGLLSIPEQTKALSAWLLTWALHESAEPNILQQLMQHHLKLMSWEKWGIGDYTWMFAPPRR
jgi:hypothetical protein